GNFTVLAKHPQNLNIYAQATGQIQNDGDSPSLTITLPAVGSVSGTVTYADGTAVSQPNVHLELPNAEWNATSTDTAGHYTITQVPVGQNLRVRAYWPSPNNWAYGETPFELMQDGDSQTVNVRLPGLANLDIHVQHPDGTPYVNAYIETKDDFRTYFQGRGVTDAGGNFIPSQCCPTAPL